MAFDYLTDFVVALLLLLLLLLIMLCVWLSFDMVNWLTAFYHPFACSTNGKRKTKNNRN